MKRRNVLLGLGTAAAGSGMVFGSGAFTQVSAKRTISIKVDDDSNSSVEIASGAAPQGGFADITTTNGKVGFDLEGETLNTDATVTVGDDTLNKVGDSPTNEQVAFVISDNSNFTDSSTDALGVEFSIGSANEIDKIEFEFIGDSSNSSLDKAATDNEPDSGTDFSSSLSDVAEAGSNTSNTTAKFVLNKNDSGTAADYSAVAAGIITLDTATGDSESKDFDVNATISAEVVEMSSNGG